MSPGSLTRIQFLLVALLTLGAALVHGYSPSVEDAEICLPGITKILDPTLSPFDADFFQSHARLTLFPNLVAGSVRLTHRPLDRSPFI